MRGIRRIFNDLVKLTLTFGRVQPVILDGLARGCQMSRRGPVITLWVLPGLQFDGACGGAARQKTLLCQGNAGEVVVLPS